MQNSVLFKFSKGVALAKQIVAGPSTNFLSNPTRLENAID